MHERAGTRALPEDLINVDDVISAYYDIVPDPTDVGQRVAFGTSGHRGASLDGKFNEAHIIAITAAIIEYRASQGINGPLFIGRDTHALSEPAWRTALEVLAAAAIDTRIDSRGSYTPTPAVSVAILGANGAPANLRTEGDGLADGIVVTPSHNPATAASSTTRLTAAPPTPMRPAGLRRAPTSSSTRVSGRTFPA